MHLHAARDQRVVLALGELGADAHQRVDLDLGALPVGDAERVERRVRDAALESRPDRATHRERALLVPRGARQPARLGPPAVAVEDDRDVMGKLVACPDYSCPDRGAGATSFGWWLCGGFEESQAIPDFWRASARDQAIGSATRNATVGGPRCVHSAEPP